jgi:hypothetical protein
VKSGASSSATAFSTDTEACAAEGLSTTLSRIVG